MGNLMDLMGVPESTCFEGMTVAAVRHLLGNSMHVGDIGTVCAIGFGIRTGLL